MPNRKINILLTTEAIKQIIFLNPAIGYLYVAENASCIPTISSHLIF